MYRRFRTTNRNKDDFQRNILMYLDKIGPSSISELIFRLETNHAVVTRTLHELIGNGLVTRQSYESLGIIKYTGGRVRTLRTNINRIGYHHHVQGLLVITDLGRECLKKQKKLAKLMIWEKPLTATTTASQ